MRHADAAYDTPYEWSSHEDASAQRSSRGRLRSVSPQLEIRIEGAVPAEGEQGHAYPNGGRCISPLVAPSEVESLNDNDAMQLHTPQAQPEPRRPSSSVGGHGSTPGDHDLELTDETYLYADHYDNISDADLQEGEYHYSSNMKLLALESLAPKLHNHIWVVHQDPKGVVEVLTPNSFKEFLRVAHPMLYGKGKDRWWVDFQGLTAAETRELGHHLKLHELTVEDMITQDSPQKLESFTDAMYRYSLITGMWPDTSRSSGWGEVSVSCILLPNFFITLHQAPFVGLDEMLQRVRKDFVVRPKARAKQTHTSTPRVMKGLWLYYCVFDILVDAIMPRVSRIRHNADQLDELILQLWGSQSPEMNDIMRMMARNRKHINELRSILAAKETVIRENKLERRAHYRDILDHLSQMMTRLDSARDIVAQANSNYLAGVSVQAAVSANRTNVGMQKISMLASAFVPMTLLTSLFGMNVQVPFQHENSTLPFFMILLSFIIPIIGVAVWWYLDSKASQARKQMPFDEMIR
eukprot:TRINITY_DN25033_c0_g1_i1.p1 TRINITY_DN25033_c0_g1~~TRINITY_DN25033_c0_g1_i1.p1  ORF type:complete len:523 (+),score=185.03 TRINITY_DN25033_c0_g1_i1:73-1641(+)